MCNSPQPGTRQEWTEVGIGVVLRRTPEHAACSDAVWEALITRRPDSTVYAGYWEFPGGKLEPGESPEEGVCREIEEETGLLVEALGSLDRADAIEHIYPHGAVRLHIRLCRLLPASPPARAIEVDDVRWTPLAELRSLRFPEANDVIVAALEGGGWQGIFEEGASPGGST